MNKPDITLTFTPAAIAHFKAVLQTNPAAKAIKIEIKDSGCSGYAYNIDFATQQSETDIVIQPTPDLTIFVPQASYDKALHNVEVDYVNEGINKLIKFNNPNAINECGCGESFQVKGEED